LSFCIEDGTPLVKTEAPAYDAEATIVSPSRAPDEGAPGGTAPEPSGAPSDWKVPAYQPPGQFPPPPPSTPKRKMWPWVVGFLTLVLLVFVGLGIAAVILVPNMMRAAQNRNGNRSTFPANVRGNENNNSNSNLNDNSNSQLNENENTNDNTNSDTSPPTDHEVVLADLKNIEDEWTVANLNADKKKLAKILADDYVGATTGGTMQGKADYLRDIKPDPTIEHWEFQNLKLTLNGSRATLTGQVSLDSSERDEPQVLRFTDKFVWRDGRWQAVSSEVSPVTESQN
jgi:hypothetical protein